MNIEIGTEPLPPDPQWQWDPADPVTGTNKFYVRVAESMARRGHRVVVRWDGQYRDLNGVQYVPRNVGHLKADLVLDCNLQRVPHGVRNFQWTSFYGRYDACVGEGYERLFLVTDFVHSTLEPYVKCPVTVLELGCEMPTVTEPRLLAREKICCYTSSPDRGGSFLQEMWPDVKAATGYDLECSAYGTSQSPEALRDLYLRSRYWLFPALGTDSILSTLEAQACGCIPFYVPHMGLPETCRYGIKTDLHRFKHDLIATLSAPTSFAAWEQTRAEYLRQRPIPTWDDVTDRILELV